MELFEGHSSLGGIMRLLDMLCSGYDRLRTTYTVRVVEYRELIFLNILQNVSMYSILLYHIYMYPTAMYNSVRFYYKRNKDPKQS